MTDGSSIDRRRSVKPGYAPGGAAGGTRVAHLGVVGLRCKDCAERVRKALLASPGVREVEVRYESASATVVYDTVTTTVGGLLQAIETASRATGHRVMGVPVRSRFSVG